MNATKHRNKILKYTKGFSWGRKSKERAAKEALAPRMEPCVPRTQGKETDRPPALEREDQCGSRAESMSYSKLIAALKKKKIAIDRKILADLAEHEPKVFKKIVKL